MTISAQSLFEGFDEFDIDVIDESEPLTIHGVRGGSGPALLLLHGFPQDHTLWHRVAQRLANQYTVVATDLRGYGQSSKPAVTTDHSNYSFRKMADDQIKVMAHLGHDHFSAVGHDRGGRVLHRMAVDHPERLNNVALLDILPTDFVFENLDYELSRAYYHWLFFLQKQVPERLISADPDFYFESLLNGLGLDPDADESGALRRQRDLFRDPLVRSAMLEDYRAAAEIDRRLDEDDFAAGRSITSPCLVLWGSRGVIGMGPHNPLDIWRTRVANPTLLTGAPVDGAGHFLVDEDPGQTVELILGFLNGSNP